jgi:S-adenosylmethionine/arginine decarboxylase-like enzyme
LTQRNSFEHFKTQPHFSNPKVQWWFGDGAKSLTLLPRSYFGTFDLVLLDLSETVMSMTVTKGLDVFGAMKLLLSDTGIMVKNDFGYFEKLSKVFDTCIQLLIPDVTYICDYELVLCGSDKVDFLNPSFDHLKGGKGPDQVETLVYKPLEDVSDHWGPVVDYSKYWGEPRKCDDVDEETNAEDEVAYAGVLLVLEAENVSFKGLKDEDKVAKEVEKVVKKLGYKVLSTTSRASAGAKDGAVVAIAMKEGYILAETWPDARYVKLDIHLWGNFEKQEEIRAQVLKSLGVKAGDWSNFRIVTTGVRGLDTRAKDLETVGPDLAKIGQCEEVKAGSNKSIMANSSYKYEEALRPIIDAGYEDIITLMIRQTEDVNAVVFCNVKGAPCRAKDSLVKQGFSNIVTMWSCSPEEEKELNSSAAKQGEFMQKWRQAMSENSSEFSLCGKKTDVALREVASKINGVNLVVVDAVAPSMHVTGCHQYYLKFWKTVKKPFLFLTPILDAGDQQRTFFLKSRYNHAEEEPEYYSEIFLGNGEKTMSFGLIHEGHSTSLQNFLRAETVLKSRKEVKFAEIRKITIRGAMRQQTNFEPVTFSWADYDQQPGLEQFYGQQPIGLQSMSQWGLDASAGALSAAKVKAAIEGVIKKFMGTDMDKDAFHEIGEGALYIALLEKGQVIVTWDGATHMNVNVFTYDESTNHGSIIVEPIMKSLPKMNLMLRDVQPRGYGGVINTSDRINRDESPECYDHYKMCPTLKKAGNCSGANNADVWMAEHCRFSCGICGKNGSSAKSEL